MSLPGHIDRTYRSYTSNRTYSRFTVKVSETDLYILADSDLRDSAFCSALRYRAQIEEYIRIHPEFKTSLVPIREDKLAPEIVRDMIRASKRAGVGPMASVAGAIAEYVGKDLIKNSANVIVENGGDIYKSEQAEGVSDGALDAAAEFVKKVAPESAHGTVDDVRDNVDKSIGNQ